MLFTEPLIFGAKDWSQPYPSIAMILQSADMPTARHLFPLGRTLHVANCYTVYLGQEDLNSGVTLGQFIHRFQLSDMVEVIKRAFDPEGIQGHPGMSICTPCQINAKRPCPIITEEKWTSKVDATMKELVQSLLRKDDVGPLASCGIINLLLRQNQTAAEQRFYVLYLHHVLRNQYRSTRSPSEGSIAALERWTKAMASGQEHIEYLLESWEALLSDNLRYPAIIPQVWLNWVPRGHDDRQFYRRNPGRVDYVYLPGGGNAVVVEIDGGVHYRDEEAYGKTLRHERQLKKMGFEVYRLTNDEVNNASTFENLEAEIGLAKWWSM